MARIMDDIADLESILINSRENHTDEELTDMEHELARLEHIHDLWMQFGDIPMDPETECMEAEFAPKSQAGNRTLTTFPAGTHREEIWYWFEETFDLSVAEDLMYGD